MENIDDLLEITHNKLVNTNLFNQVTLIPQFSEDSSHLDLSIEVEESWQLFIISRLKFADRNINAWLKSDEPDKFSRLYYEFSVKNGKLYRPERAINGFFNGRLQLYWEYTISVALH